MKYFHRTSISPDDVIEAATRFFGAKLTPATEEPRGREFLGSIGRIAVHVEAEGGHYTRVDVQTDQVGESEADKMAKRFLAEVHALAEPRHSIRGSY
jgi:hypothetical protein